MKKIIIALLGIAMLVSCEDFLSKLPDNRTNLDSPSAIQELLVSAYPEGCFQSFTEVMSDNAGDKGQGRYVVEFLPNEYSYYWKDDSSDDYDTPTDYWNYCYQAIAAANQALDAIKKNGDGPEYASAKGEALAARAYSHFMLANIFGKQYNPTTAATDLAVPFVDEPEDVVFKSYVRTTVDDVYKRVEADLLQAEKLITDDTYKVPRYHFTTDALNAFFSRIYLYKADWNKVISYSSKVLGANPAEKIRDWNGKYINLEFRELWAQYSKSEEPANILLMRGYTAWASGCIVLRYSLAPNKVKELFQMEYGNPFELIIGDRITYAASDQQMAFVPKYPDRIESVAGIGRGGYPNTIIPIFTTAELLFNRAEAYVMQGEYDKALADINSYLTKTAKDYRAITEDDIIDIYTAEPGPDIAAFYPINERQKFFIWSILDLRRKEFVHEGLRWFDVKRFDIEVVHNVFDGADIKLPKGDPRRVVQIPSQAVATGLEPNPR
ncbi:MAG TPA: RagB/SusD family nutrient uptake outer membrane protein [Petrimonas sp.]|uniref:RagB/SusD family nutrient uptake outer membrane protein n=1 Tax=Petrimonas sp. TaxID=2023866 RepID=UPI001771E240|nr:RagB/SusD family nutrient uptake outer membrane protein [Petrimonas sp.]